MKPSEAIRHAIDLLDGGNRWIKRHWETEHGWCWHGALNQLGLDQTTRHQAIDAMHDAINQHTGLPASIMGYNDDPATTFEDLALMSKHAAADLEQREM